MIFYTDISVILAILVSAVCCLREQQGRKTELKLPLLSVKNRHDCHLFCPVLANAHSGLANAHSGDREPANKGNH